MKIRVLAFAMAKDQLGFSEQETECQPDETTSEVIRRLAPSNDIELQHWRVALDQSYASWEQAIGDAQELAIIPPVSGG